MRFFWARLSMPTTLTSYTIFAKGKQVDNDRNMVAYAFISLVAYAFISRHKETNLVVWSMVAYAFISL